MGGKKTSLCNIELYGAENDIFFLNLRRYGVKTKQDPVFCKEENEGSLEADGDFFL